MAHCPTKRPANNSNAQAESWVPTPEEIRQRAAEIRRSWSPEVRRQREMPLPGWHLLPLILGGRLMQPLPALAAGRFYRG